MRYRLRLEGASQILDVRESVTGKRSAFFHCLPLPRDCAAIFPLAASLPATILKQGIIFRWDVFLSVECVGLGDH